MLRLISGSFHPDLEKNFADLVGRQKTDPWTKFAVVAPSRHLMNRLQILFSEKNLSLLGVHFFTFSSFAQTLLHEQKSLSKTVLSDPLFFDTLTKIIVRSDRPFPGLEDLAVPQGFPPQIRDTIRDMVDAGIPYDRPVLFEALKENFLGRNVDLGWLLQLMRFYQLYNERVQKLPGVMTKSESLRQATSVVESSAFLNQFHDIVFYGFTDMTGLQKDLFESISKNYNVTLFLPFRKDNSAYAFSQKFRDRHLAGLIEEEINCEETKGGISADSDEFLAGISSTEVFNVSGLRDEAWRVAGEILFRHHRDGIPFHEMAVVARSKDRFRKHWLEIFRQRNIPFQVTRSLSIANSPLIETALGCLQQASSKDLSDRSEWSSFVQQATSILETKLGPQMESEIGKLMEQGLMDMARFDLIGQQTSRKEFLEALEERWVRTEHPVSSQSEFGVQLLHAEAARGLPFEVVFVVGLEERVFPRILREDPFLRDEARFQLEHLGFKIGEKLKALEEERQLFHLIVRSAQKSLYMSYQRTDEEGKVVGPSSFLRAFADKNNIDLEKITETVPRPYREKCKASVPEKLGARDILFRLLVAGYKKEALHFSEVLDSVSGSLDKGLSAQEKIQGMGRPSGHDGLISPIRLEEAFPQGLLSASRMEIYGRCPFQFFTTKMLDLQKWEEKEPGVSIPPDKKGTLIHTFLETFYSSEKWKVKGPFPTKYFTEVNKEVFGPVTSEEMEVHPVIWQVEKIKILEGLKHFLLDDLEALKASGQAPTFLEASISSALEEMSRDHVWFGKPDRIDVRGYQAEIIDYKTGSISSRPLLASLQGFKIQPALYILLVKKHLIARGMPVDEITFSYRRLGNQLATAELTYIDWLNNKEEILKTMQTQLKHMFNGDYPIIPDAKYCSWCEVQTICRKNHGPSLYRSKQGPGTELRNLRLKKPKSQKKMSGHAR